MRTVIIACQTLQDELRLAIRKTGVSYPVFYIESGLHNTPDALHQRIQKEIDQIDNVDVVLLVFGFCGNSLVGIKSDKVKLVLPKVDDCIPLLLGSTEARKRISKEMGTYFLTKGWLDYESNLIWEYDRCVQRYGQARALKVMHVMLANYKRFMVIDTGAYPTAGILAKTQDFADKLNMRNEVVPGSSRLLHKLLQGPWDEEFIVLEPGRSITMNDVCGDGSEQSGSQIASFQSFGG